MRAMLSGDQQAAVRVGAWFDDRELALPFPTGWDVIHCPPRGGPDIGADGIAAALAAPIGTPRLTDLARGRSRACIVIDDLSRPTPAGRLVPPLLDELADAGIAADDVLVLAGVANHRPMTRPDLLKKLGDDVLARCRVVNHFSWSNCEHIGTTSFGTPVEINADFLGCDLRILVGSIVPHAATGFAGGAKLLLPGIASIASAASYHAGTARRGAYADVVNDARLESEEAARLAGVDFIVNAVPNGSMGIAGLVAGDVVHAHRAGTTIAKQVFASPTPTETDVCVLSLYPKDTEFIQHVTALAPYTTAPEPIVRDGGTIVIVAEASEGFGHHTLFGPGMEFAPRHPTRVRGRDLVFLAPNTEPASLPPETRAGTVLFRTWDELLAWLQVKHGSRARVAVYPCATIQLAEAVC